MEVKEAIAAAKNYVKDIYAEEHVSNIGLEEVAFDDQEDRWSITIGFSRPWNATRTRAQEISEGLGSPSALKRSYKRLVINRDGRVLSMRDREQSEVSK